MGSYSLRAVLPPPCLPPLRPSNQRLKSICCSCCNSSVAPIRAAFTAAVAAALVLTCSSSSFFSFAQAVQPPPPDADTFFNVPQTLSSPEAAEGDAEAGKKRGRIQRPKSRKAESCTSKCVGTCILGGAGSPGEGPLNIRRPLVVFKEGFRTRQYCLSECSDICNLIKDGDDGP